MPPFVSVQTLFLSGGKGIFKDRHPPDLRSSKATEEGNSKDKENKVQEPPQTCLGEADRHLALQELT